MNNDPIGPIHYARKKISWRRRAWCIIRPALWVIAPLGIYVGAYIAFSQRTYMWGGGFAVKYPGVVRFYALEPKMAASLGRSEELIEEQADAGGAVRQFDGSLLFMAGGWSHHLWRAFYPAERAEMMLRGIKPIPIAYSGPAPATVVARASLPFIGPVYEDWCVRDGRLYRFVQGVSAARQPSNAVERRNDVYLFEWSMDGPWDEKPREATRARLVETNSRAKWEQHWIIDADHFLTWNANNGETQTLACGANGKTANVTATAKGLRPVRCNTASPISVSPSGRFLAGESDGLRILRSENLEVVRRVPENAAAKRFFQARPDELDNTNSSCFLMDDGATLARVVTIYKKNGEDFINGTVVVVFNVETGEVRDVPVNVGARADVRSAALVEGKLTLYLVYTTGDGKWKQCLFTEGSDKLVDLHPENRQPDMAIMGWDADRKIVVDLPGFEANPQPLELDSEVLLEKVGTADRRLLKIRYGDARGLPSLFKIGLNTLSEP